MKKILILLLGLVIIAGCGGLVTFYITDEADITIPSGTGLNLPIDIPIPPTETSHTEEYDNNNTAPELLKEVSLDKLEATITNPADDDFSFLKDIEIYIKKSDDSDEKLIAYLYDINSSAQTITLETTGENLVEYLREDSYKLETKVTVKEVLGHDVDIHLNLRFKIVADILKK